ncbi:MAG: ABC transporter substrate-binding protein [Chloroflexota bacterium]|jgi:putative tryptophan/tyrosine transport system substrate-binding protein
MKRKSYQSILLTFITIIILSATFLLTGCREDEPEMVTIGVVNLAPPLEFIFDGFKEGMAEFGYVEGETIVYIYEGPAGSMEALEPAVQQLVDANVDLILSLSTPATQVVRQTTTTIPTVFAPVTFPVEAGVVADMTLPGGNITGVTFGTSDGQRLEWLLRIAPDVERVFIPYNPEDGSPVGALAVVESVAGELGVELVTVETRTPAEITEAVNNIPEDIDAVFLLPDSLVVAQVAEFAQVTRQRQLPLSVPNDTQVMAGALISFGFSMAEIGKQSARLADHILNGADPAETPVEFAEFFLTINLETADIIGLEVPDEILRQADTIIR